MKPQKFITALIFGLFFSSMAGFVHAASVAIGETSGPRSLYPFGYSDFGGVNGANDIYQQLYRADQFGSSPVRITRLTFDEHELFAGIGIYTDTEIFLSTAANPVSAPSVTFAANRGADFTRVYFGSQQVGFAGFPIDPCAICTESTLSFDITPFDYDPSQGDLLVEVRQQGVGFSFDSDNLYFEAGSSRFVSSIAMDGGLFGDPAVHLAYGLWTEFEASPVPLPPALWLFGVAAAGLVVRSRRASATDHSAVRAISKRPL